MLAKPSQFPFLSFGKFRGSLSLYALVEDGDFHAVVDTDAEGTRCRRAPTTGFLQQALRKANPVAEKLDIVVGDDAGVIESNGVLVIDRRSQTFAHGVDLEHLPGAGEPPVQILEPGISAGPSRAARLVSPSQSNGEPLVLARIVQPYEISAHNVPSWRRVVHLEGFAPAHPVVCAREESSRTRTGDAIGAPAAQPAVIPTQLQCNSAPTPQCYCGKNTISIFYCILPVLMSYIL